MMINIARLPLFLFGVGGLILSFKGYGLRWRVYLAGDFIIDLFKMIIMPIFFVISLFFLLIGRKVEWFFQGEKRFPLFSDSVVTNPKKANFIQRLSLLGTSIFCLLLLYVISLPKTN